MRFEHDVMTSDAFYRDHQSVNIEDVEVVYYDSHADIANNDELPVLFALHSVPTSGYLYRSLVGHLPCRLIIPDLPGFGRSQKQLPWAATPHQYRAWLAHFVRGLVGQHRSVYMMGQDFGALMALQWGLDRPQHLMGLILLNTYLYPETLRPFYWPLLAVLPSLGAYPVERLMSQAWIAMFLKKLYRAPVSDSLISAYSAIYKDPAARRALLNFLWHTKRLPRLILDIRRRMSEITCPVMTLFGEAKGLYGRGLDEKLSNRFKYGSQRILPRVGYQIMDEVPDVVLAELEALLNKGTC